MTGELSRRLETRRKEVAVAMASSQLSNYIAKRHRDWEK
jgi:hypothetical protein